MALEKILLLSSMLSCSDYSINKKERAEIIYTEETREETGISNEDSCVYMDTFVVDHACVDIITVVDTSGSMMHDQENNEIRGVEDFLTYFTREKLQAYPNPMMMVITGATDVEGYSNNPITSSDAQTTTTWTLEESSGTTEAPLEALISYVKSDHAIWMREECSLYFMMFSDEDDQSYSEFSFDTEGDNAAVDQFLTDLTATVDEQEKKEIYFNAGINPIAEHQCYMMAEANQIGYRFEQIAAYYNGNINDLCSSYVDWNTVQIASTEYDGWQLTYIPDPSTIVVYIDGQLATTACTYDDESVFYSFEENLVNGTEIKISYEIDKNSYPNQECPL